MYIFHISTLYTIHKPWLEAQIIAAVSEKWSLSKASNICWQSSWDTPKLTKILGLARGAATAHRVTSQARSQLVNITTVTIWFMAPI